VTDKQRIIEFIQRMPDDISVAEAIYKLRFLEKVEAGLRELDAGEGIPHEEVEREFCGPDFDP
jgi:predicted transcriptional regulator